MNRRIQSGLTTVEFAISGAAFMMVLFGCMEISRLMYTLNALTEASRAGARIATVCNYQNPAVLLTAILNQPGDTTSSEILHNLTTGNITLRYLDAAGAPITTQAGAEANARFVQVSIAGYSIPLHIPFIDLTVPAPSFTTTLPRESLGLVPETASYGCLYP